MRTSINLATAPFIPARRFLLTVGSLAVVALAATLFAGVEAVRTWQERTATAARVRELTAERGRLFAEQRRLQEELQAPALRQVLDRTQFFNGLVRRKNLSWTNLVLDLQERLPARVRILALSPSLRDDGRLQVEMQVGGESAQALIGFVQALEKSANFQEIALHSQDPTTRARADAVTAQLSVVYVEE